VAVAAEPSGVDIHRLDHRPPAADAGPAPVEDRPAVTQRGDIGRRAAHIYRPDILPARQMPGPDHACCRTRQNRLDGPPHGPLRGHQGAIPLDHHQRGRNVKARERFLHRCHELAQRHNQMGIEGDGGRAADCVELAGQFMAAGDGQPGQFLDQRLHAQLVGRVAHGEVPGDRERLHLVTPGQNGRARGRLIEGRQLVAQPIMAPGQIDHIPRGQLTLEIILAHQRRVVTNQQETHRPALPFREGVRRQRGRERDQRHVDRPHRRALLLRRLEDGFDRP